MDTTQTTIVVAFGALSFACLGGYIRRCLRTRMINSFSFLSRPPPTNTPLPPQMPQASEYTPVTQNPLPSAPIYQPPQQYVVYIPPQQGYLSYPQQMPYYPPLSRTLPYQV